MMEIHLKTADLKLQWAEFRSLHREAKPNPKIASPFVSLNDLRRRMQIFADNMKKLNLAKRQNPHATFGVSVYSHLTESSSKQIESVPRINQN
jgi:hypothetical protein